MSENKTEKSTGVVDFCNKSRGYGYINDDELEGDDVFFLLEASNIDLSEGDTVAYDVVFEENGPRARNIEKINR